MSKHRIDADDPFWVPPTPEPEEFCVCADIPDPECPYCPDLSEHDCDVEFLAACGFCDLNDLVAREPWHSRAWAWVRNWWRENWGSAIFGLILGAIINCLRGDWAWPFTTTETGVLCIGLALAYVLWLGCRR